MALNKKAFRKHADPGLRFSPGNGMLHAEQIRCIIRTAVQNIAGRRTLLLYVYDRPSAAAGQCEQAYTVFQTKGDYVTLARTDNGAIKWRTACFSNLFPPWDDPRKACAFYSRKDEQALARFCGCAHQAGIPALMSLQASIMAARKKSGDLAKERKIIARMEAVPPPPRDLKGWIHRELLPAYIIYNYHRGKKPMGGYCTACRHSVQVSGAKHNQTGQCPRCGKPVTNKSSGRLGRFFDRATAQVIQRVGENELLIRIFKVSKTYQAMDASCMRIWESARVFVRRDESGQTVVSPLYYSYSGNCILTRWKKGARPVFNRWADNFEASVCGHLYHRNLGAALSGTPWQYCQIGPFYLQDREPLEAAPYFSAYSKHPMIEYLVKLGLHRLAASVVYREHECGAMNLDGQNLREILGVGPEYIPLLQTLNATVWHLGLT
jgi:hypothetical protein